MRSKSSLRGRSNPPASLVQAHIDTLTQGVSQQPTHLRQVGQGGEAGEWLVVASQWTY